MIKIQMSLADVHWLYNVFMREYWDSIDNNNAECYKIAFSLATPIVTSQFGEEDRCFSHDDAVKEYIKKTIEREREMHMGD